VIEFVDEKGPAYAAGVRSKDVLVELRGKPVSAVKLSEIRRALGEEDQPLTMTVERGGKRIEIRFTPYEYEDRRSNNAKMATPDGAQEVAKSRIPAVRPFHCRGYRTR